MKHITFKKKLIAILSAMVLAVSCPIIAMAEDDYSSASTIKTEASKETSRMTSSDWAELQSQADVTNICPTLPIRSREGVEVSRK